MRNVNIDTGFYFCIEEIVMNALEQLGLSRVIWENLVSWETEILTSLLEELEGIPVAFARIIETHFERVNARERHSRS